MQAYSKYSIDSIKEVLARIKLSAAGGLLSNQDISEARKVVPKMLEDAQELKELPAEVKAFIAEIVMENVECSFKSYKPFEEMAKDSDK